MILCLIILGIWCALLTLGLLFLLWERSEPVSEPQDVFAPGEKGRLVEFDTTDVVGKTTSASDFQAARTVAVPWKVRRRELELAARQRARRERNEIQQITGEV